MSISEIATTDVVTASSDSPVSDLVSKMDSENVGTVVITDDNDPIGIVSDRMIVMKVTETDSITDLTAEDVMTEDPVTVEESAMLSEALDRMQEHGIRRLPIVDDDGTLTGLVSLDDVLVEMNEQSEKVSQLIEKQVS